MTMIRNGFFVLVVLLVLGVALSKGHTGNGNSGDDGVRVTFDVTVRDFNPGDEKPRVHYRMQNVAPQPEQLSSDEGIPVDKDGHYRKSLGMVTRGTYILVWVTEPPNIKKRPFIECKLYFDGSMVDHDTNATDTVVVCEKEVV